MRQERHKVGRPTTEEAEQLRLRIVEAAFGVFVREGFGGATMDEIAKDSRTTRRSVSYRFANKEELFIAVTDLRARGLQTAFYNAIREQSDDPVVALRAFCRSLLDEILTPMNLDFYRLVVAEAAKFPVASQILMRLNDRIVLDLEDLIARAQLAGTAFLKKEPWAVATSMIGMFVSNPVNRKTMGDRDFYDPAALDRYFERMWALTLG